MSRLRALWSWKVLLAIVAVVGVAASSAFTRRPPVASPEAPEPAWSSERPYAALHRQ
jgi:hypothetical protein